MKHLVIASGPQIRGIVNATAVRLNLSKEQKAVVSQNKCEDGNLYRIELQSGDVIECETFNPQYNRGRTTAIEAVFPN